MRVTGYDTGGFYDEMFDAASKPRPEAQLLLDTIAALGDGQLATLPAGRRARPAPARHHVQRLRRHGRHRADLPVRPRAAHHRRRRMGLDRARAQAAHPRAQPVHRRHLPRAEDRQGRRHPGGDRPLGRAVYRPQCVGIEAAAAASGATSPAPIWCATATARSTCSRTTCACPSGVSYVLENRDVMKRTFPQVFERLRDASGRRLPEPAARDAASPSRRAGVDDRRVVVLTPGHATTRPTSSTASWRSRWASSWSKGRDLVVDGRPRVDADDARAASAST